MKSSISQLTNHEKNYPINPSWWIPRDFHNTAIGVSSLGPRLIISHWGLLFSSLRVRKKPTSPLNLLLGWISYPSSDKIPGTPPLISGRKHTTNTSTVSLCLIYSYRIFSPVRFVALSDGGQKKMPLKRNWNLRCRILSNKSMDTYGQILSKNTPS